MNKLLKFRFLEMNTKIIESKDKWICTSYSERFIGLSGEDVLDGTIFLCL